MDRRAGRARLLFCDNETNVRRLFGTEVFAGAARHAVPQGRDQRPCRPRLTNRQPERHRHEGGVPPRGRPSAPGETREVRVRLVVGSATRRCDLGADFDVGPDGLGPPRPTRSGPGSARRPRGDVRTSPGRRSRDCCPASSSTPTTSRPGWPATRASRRRPHERRDGRNAGWRHLSAADVILMPDTWEYPWFASWDLAFQCVALAHVDPELAKSQLLLLLGERFQHPGGQVPAYEWNFSRPEPTGPGLGRDADLPHRRGARPDVPRARAAQAADERDLVAQPRRRRGRQPLRGRLPRPRQHRAVRPVRTRCPTARCSSRATGRPGWRCICLDLLTIAVTLGEQDPAYDGLAATFLDRFCSIAGAANGIGSLGRRGRLLLRPAAPPERRRRSGCRCGPPSGLIPIMAVGQLSARRRWTRCRGWPSGSTGSASTGRELVDLMHFDEE